MDEAAGKIPFGILQLQVKLFFEGFTGKAFHYGVVQETRTMHIRKMKRLHDLEEKETTSNELGMHH